MLLSVVSQAYDWNSVTIKGDGFIDGIVYNPAAPNTVYIHTDMGGAYRWDQSLSKWMPMTDWLQYTDSDCNNGAESIAVDPTNANRVYMVAGTYGSAATVLRSTDGGRTWLRTNVSGIAVDGNGWGRGLGERMAVDPNLPSIIFYGARDWNTTQRGLWKSTDYAASWNQVFSFTTYGDVWNWNYSAANGVGLPFVIFDKASGTPGSATPRIYVGVNTAATSNAKLFRTSNGGTTWEAVPNQPSVANFPLCAELSADGSVMYVTYGSQAGPLSSSDTGGVVYKVADPYSASPTWTVITPSIGSGIFAAIAIDPTNSKVIYTSAQNNWPCNIYCSTNGGSSWTALNPNAHRDDSSAPYASSQTIHWLTDLEIDPYDDNVAIFNTGYGLYRTTNLTATTPTWTFFDDGFEQSAALELISPPSGSANLLSAIGDRDGFRHVDFSVSPAAGQFSPSYGSDRDIDFAENNPNIMVRIGDSEYISSQSLYKSRGSFSTNGGATWTNFSYRFQSSSSFSAGNIAISADGTHIVWAVPNFGVYYSTNNGTSWTLGTGTVPPNTAVIVSDRVNANKFYAYSGSTFYISTNGGVTWSTQSTSNVSGSTWIRPLPGYEGNLFISRGSSYGLWRSTDSGATWTRVNSTTVTVANQVGIGMGPTPGSYPSIFIGGTVGGQNGFFRSDDQGATWVQISDLSHQYGAVTVIQGDERVYGRLYVGANGRGILYADIHTPQTYLPDGWNTQDIGSPGSTGSAGSPSDGTWELIGGGAGVSGTADAFRFTYISLTGDSTITAEVMGVPSDSPSNHNAKAGVMIRNGLDPGAANVFLAISSSSANGAFFQYRSATGGSTAISTNPGVWSPYWVRLTRSGDTFTAYYSADGTNWTPVGTAVIAMNATLEFGLAVTTSDNNQLDVSSFQNVSIYTPTHTWDGGSLVNNLWTTKENWVDNIAPDPGDNLIFPAGAAQLINYNDYSSTTVFGTITVSGSGYQFQGNAYQASTVVMLSNANAVVNAIQTITLTIGPGATLTIAPLPGGPTAANDTLTPVADNDLSQPEKDDSIAELTAPVTNESSSTTPATLTPEPVASGADLASPAAVSSQAAPAPASPDDLSNSALAAVATPLEITADAASPLILAKSTPAIRIDADSHRPLPQSPIYLPPDSKLSHNFFQSGLEQSLAPGTGNLAGTMLPDSSPAALPLPASKSQKHSAISDLNSRQALLAALQTVTQNSPWTSAGPEKDLDIAEYLHAGKHSKQSEKAVDEVLAEVDAILSLL